MRCTVKMEILDDPYSFLQMVTPMPECEAAEIFGKFFCLFCQTKKFGYVFEILFAGIKQPF